jgi:hypothetical protein
MFYIPAIKCTITPTRARMVMEMAMMKAVDDRVITPAEKKACTLTNGHSEATVKKFYSLHDRWVPCIVTFIYCTKNDSLISG